MKTRNWIVALIAAAAFGPPARGAELTNADPAIHTSLGNVGASSNDSAYLSVKPEELKWFTDARFGMMICWNPCSQMGGEIGWSRGELRPGMPKEHPMYGPMDNAEHRGIPEEIYDNLYETFNPEKFNAREWVQIIKTAGMKYLFFVTKHHDGFCMFDSKLTDYDIGKTPYGRDVCKELADACHAAGTRIGWCYSPPDWHHPDFWTENHDRYVNYMHGQVRELLTNYGKIDVMWYDSLLGHIADRMDRDQLFKMMRQLALLESPATGTLLENLLPKQGTLDLDL